MKSILSISIAALLLSACNSSDNTPLNTQNTVSTLPIPGQTTAPVKVNDTAVNTVPVSAVVQTQTPANNQTSTNTGNAKLNPAHGQPGHRCDIAVGAPLDSPPATQTTNTQVQPQPVNPVPQTVASGPVPDTLTVNPAHGMPGHDCAIPVGQPLKKN